LTGCVKFWRERKCETTLMRALRVHTKSWSKIYIISSREQVKGQMYGGLNPAPAVK